MENKKICIFDVDGTLVDSTKQITHEMLETVKNLKMKGIEIIIVAGGSYDKVIWQLQDHNIFNKIYTECGAIYYEDGTKIMHKNFIDSCDRNIVNNIIKRALLEISKMPIIYSGHQIDFRSGLIYVSPVGQQAGDYERSHFIELDKQMNLRELLVKSLKEEDQNDDFEIVFGGNVGVSVYPKGWDKSQVMKYFDVKNQEIYFFGDRVDPSGNDYSLYAYPGVNGFGVKTYKDTIEILEKLFLK